MNAYVIHDGDNEENAYLIFAHTLYQAFYLAGEHGIDIDNDYIDGFEIKCELQPDNMGVCEDNKILRNAGFHCHGDNYCDTCGLAEMGGEYPICLSCGQCVECGCSCKN